MIPTVVISARGEQRLRGGHPWIYRADVADVRASGGDIVHVRSPRGQLVGSALFSDRSQITLRMLTHGEQPADAALVRRRIETAIAFRESLAMQPPARLAERIGIWLAKQIGRASCRERVWIPV